MANFDFRLNVGLRQYTSFTAFYNRLGPTDVYTHCKTRGSLGTGYSHTGCFTNVFDIQLAGEN